ncbi:MAG: protocatechuate 3,4-dioxygenase [Sphingomicrobium sp.]
MIKLSRRQFAGAGLASAGLVLASGGRALAQPPLTAESAMGPFYPLDMPGDSDADLTWVKGHSKRAEGQIVEVRGRVLDVRGNSISGAAIVVWQANAAGRYVHPSDISNAPLDPNFHGIASVKADSKGEWRLTTIKPGGYDSPIGHRPPHIHFDVRGLKHRNIAQLYFPEDADANARDSLYKMLGAQAATSVAMRDANDPARYSWDIVVLG